MSFTEEYTKLGLSVWESGRRERERTGSEWPKEVIMAGVFPIAVLANNQEEYDRYMRYNNRFITIAPWAVVGAIIFGVALGFITGS